MQPKTAQFDRPSRWILRAMEWNDPKARYPNIWHADMPAHVLATARMAGRLRLGDLIAVFHPASSRHPSRSERFVGLSRVVGLRRAGDEDFAWVDLETAHRFASPLSAVASPRRVFLCCDPGWPAEEVALFQRVFAAAVAEGWRPRPAERHAPERDGRDAPGPGDPGRGRPSGGAGASGATAPEAGPIAPEDTAPKPVEPISPGTADLPPPGAPQGGGTGAADEPGTPDGANGAPPTPDRAPAVTAPAGDGGAPGGRLFAGADFSGDMRDPRRSTWLALLELRGDALHVRRLEPTGRSGLQVSLRDPDTLLMQAEAIGLDFPFGLPRPFAEHLLGGSFPGDGWWALARRLEKMSRPDYLTALKDFRDARGEIKRLTDERCEAYSPLHRANPDLGPTTFHGIRMIAEDRSRFAIRPFESAQGRLLLETWPGGLVRRLPLRNPGGAGGPRPTAILAAMGELPRWPVGIDGTFRKRCLEARGALDAIMAARCAAAAVLSGEADRRPDELAPGEGARVQVEGWIYGLEEGEG